jgi:hypothetical protein
MIHEFEVERLQSALAQRKDEYTFAIGWKDAEWEQLSFDDMLDDVQVKDGDTWRKLWQEEKFEIYCDVFNIGEDKRHLYRAHYGLPAEKSNLKGVTISGSISLEFESSLDGQDLARYVNSLIQAALERHGVKVINVDLDVFEVWDPKTEG